LGGGRRWGTRALELARRLGDVETEANALATLGIVEGRQTLERSLELAHQAGFTEQVARAYVLLATIAVDTRAHAAAGRDLEAGIGYCSDRGIELHRLYLLAGRARLELDEGRWDEAADTAAAVLRIPRTSTTPRIVALSVLALVRARRGDPGWEPLLDEAWARAEPTNELPRLGRVAVARAEAFWLDGDNRSVLEATDAAFDLAQERMSPWFAGELACWRRRAGANERIPASIAKPYALQLAGDWEGAYELWSRIGCPYEAALALVDAAEEEPLREALEQLRRLGAARTSAIVLRRLRGRGARGLPRGPRPATRSNPAGLTAREQEVLALVAEGRRNGEIAERLVVSRKTIDHHVSAILRKLAFAAAARPRPKPASSGSSPKIGNHPSQDREGCRCSSGAVALPSRAMPRYLVERAFTERWDAGADVEELCRQILDRNRDEVTWLHSYVSEDGRKLFCVYESPTPEAIRKSAGRNDLPVDTITSIRVLDPYQYFHR